jgi:hypothetical protein
LPTTSSSIKCSRHDARQEACNRLVPHLLRGITRHVVADALEQNLAVGVRAAIADHLGRTDNAGDRGYLVPAKPNVIMNDTRLRGLAVAGSQAPVARARTTTRRP